MADGKLEGLFVMGQNPAVGAPNARLERKALSKLKWLVVRDMVEIETATFWLDSPEIANGELRTEEIDTEVFLFPAASHVEKAGTFTNTQRLLQWREQAVEPPGDARSELHFIYHLGRLLKEKATDAPRDAGLRALTWDYPTHGPIAEPDPEAVLREIHGSSDAGPIKHFGELKNDGTTSCGCWIYSGVYDGENKANGRDAHGKYGHGWGYAWPLDRRILYNRASAAPDGTPWSERKKLIWWDEAKGEWTGDDVADFTKKKPPDAKGDPDKGGDEALPATRRSSCIPTAWAGSSSPRG